MDQGLVLDVVRDAVWTTILVSAPMLGFALFIGLIVSIFQTITSIQENTLTFAPKIIAVLIALVIFGPWMLSMLTEFTTNLYTNLNVYLK